MVTIATNMAGRGTDILLGGNAEFMTRQELVKKGRARAISVAEGAINPMAPAGFLRFYYQGQEFEVAEPDWADDLRSPRRSGRKRNTSRSSQAGGLFILGTERHESRRIDNQLRGRAGRQGDPGESRFYLSLEDDLMRIFAKQWVSTLLERLGMEEGVPIESKMISNRIEAAQKAVEAQNFESRKHLLEYDDVMNKQREAVYGLRRQLLEGVEQRELILEDYVGGILSSMLDEFAPEDKHPDQWNIKGLDERLMGQFGFSLAAAGIKPLELARHELGDDIFEKLKEDYESKEKILGAEHHALSRAHGHAERHRRPVEGSPALDGPPEGRHRPARLCAAGSAGGLQARVLRHVRSHDGRSSRKTPSASSSACRSSAPTASPIERRAAARARRSAGSAGGQRRTVDAEWRRTTRR